MWVWNRTAIFTHRASLPRDVIITGKWRFNVSKKHFNKIAEALLLRKPIMPPDSDKFRQWEGDVKAMADVCSCFNNLFDYQYFLQACGLRG